MMADSTSRVTTAYVVDHGKLRRKRVRELKNGSGRRLNRHIDLATKNAWDEHKQQLSENTGSRIVPVVVVFRKKVKKKRQFGFG
jgi:hypothetical protein